MLTGLLMLWMAAGEVRGQHLYNTSEGFPVGGVLEDKCGGVAVWRDGTTFSAFVNDGPATDPPGSNRPFTQIYIHNGFALNQPGSQPEFLVELKEASSWPGGTFPDSWIRVTNMAASAPDLEARLHNNGFMTTPNEFARSAYVTGEFAGVPAFVWDNPLTGPGVDLEEPLIVEPNQLGEFAPSDVQAGFVMRLIEDVPTPTGLSNPTTAWDLRPYTPVDPQAGFAVVWGEQVLGQGPRTEVFTTDIDVSMGCPFDDQPGDAVPGRIECDGSGYHEYAVVTGWAQGPVVHAATGFQQAVSNGETYTMSGTGAMGFAVLYDQSVAFVKEIPVPTAAVSSGFIPIDGNGFEKVTAVAIDRRARNIVICGTMTTADVAFDPHNASPANRSPAYKAFGKQDIFVAVYDLFDDATQHGLQLDSLYTFGTSQYDDVATSVAVASDGTIYVTGGYGHFWQLMGGGASEDVPVGFWVASIKQRRQFEGVPLPYIPQKNPGQPQNWLNWEFIANEQGDDRGMDVAVDHLDRCVVAGQFGWPRRVGQGPVPYCQNFDPFNSPAGQVCTTGGTDAVIVKYWQDGTFHSVEQMGGDDNESATHIDIDPHESARTIVGGWFGNTQPAGYTIDVNPFGPVPVQVTSMGTTDGFAAIVDQRFPENVQTSVMVLAQNASDVDPEVGDPNINSQYFHLFEHLAGLIEDETPAQPGNLPAVPRDGRAAVNVTLQSAYGYPGLDPEAPGIETDNRVAGPASLMPWTVIDSERVADAFAHRLRHEPGLQVFFTRTNPSVGQAFARVANVPAYLTNQGVGNDPEDHRAVVSLSNGPEELQFDGCNFVAPADLAERLNATRDALLDLSGGGAGRVVDTIASVMAWSGSLGVTTVDPSTMSPYQPTPRQYLLDNASGSDAVFPAGWSSGVAARERNIAFALSASDTNYPCNVFPPPPSTVNHNPGFEPQSFRDAARLSLMRLTSAPGDYDRDGVVEFTFGGSCFGCTTTGLAPCGEDWTKFFQDTVAAGQYADWNFDNAWDGDQGSNIPVLPDLFGIDFSKFFTGALGGCP